MSYEGRVESDFYGTPFMAGKHSSEKYHGKYYNTPMMDIHYEKGMECIDCHTQFDTMGDGNLYSKKHEQAEVRCQDCHGTYKEGIITTKITDPDDRVIRLGMVSPNYENKVGDEMVVTARGNKYTNANAHNRQKAGAMIKVNRTMDPAKYMEVKPKIQRKMFRFVGFCTAKNNPTGMKNAPIPIS